MVDVNQIKSVLNQFQFLFQEVKEKSKNKGDLERAIYGLSKVRFIKDKLSEFEENPQNKIVKQINAGFVSLTRGVEFFDDYNTNKKFNELFNNIPIIEFP